MESLIVLQKILCHCANIKKLWTHPNLAVKFLIRVYTDIYINGLHNKNQFW